MIPKITRNHSEDDNGAIVFVERGPMNTRDPDYFQKYTASTRGGPDL